MRLTPSQIGVRLICGQMVRFGPEQSLLERIREGRESLVQITGRDFAYDLQAWHDHLKVSREGGYTYGRNIALPQLMLHALESSTWQEAIQQLSKSSD